MDREFQEAADALASSQRERSLFRNEILGKSLMALLNLAYQEGKIGFFDVRLAHP